MKTTPAPAPYIDRFESLAYGLFVHWGLYSQVGQGEWYKKWHGVPMDTYRELIKGFTAEAFNAGELARFAKRCGMKYICLTTRHHDGFSLYDTRGLNTYDAPHSPAGRDLISEFVVACRGEGIVPFFYHTTLDWSRDTETCDDKAFAEYIDYLIASVEILCTQYGDIGGLWFDGNWSRPGADWQEDRLYSMIRRHQPEAIIVNNSSINALGAKGHPMLDVVTYEQGRPEPMDRGGMAKYVAAEMCQTMNLHWGIGSRDFMYKSPAEVITDLAACRRAGANYLLNIGPTAGGRVPPYEAACLERVGDWANLMAPALYETRPVACGSEGRDFVLRHKETGKRYYFAHDLPITNNDHKTKEAGAHEGPRRITGLEVPSSARWLDTGEELDIIPEGDGFQLYCKGYPYGSNLVVRVAEIS
ncbi:MAG: alpha-L-fucosidase [Verrucomicrobia bacterium]|nr:alpha-L-fucosidase [Verrucomicrobiota bacterium]MCH8526304.1 alpha-L-fucosidase [Kiritimatiellia bacterium]